jgi:hypothetical protein
MGASKTSALLPGSFFRVSLVVRDIGGRQVKNWIIAILRSARALLGATLTYFLLGLVIFGAWRSFQISGALL